MFKALFGSFKNYRKRIAAKQSYRDNVRYVLRDKDGNIKPIFQENWLYRVLLKRGLVTPFTPQTSKLAFLFGRWSDARVLSNLVTSAGKAGGASRINGSGAEAAFTYIALGTGTTAAAVGDTTLQTEIVASGGERAAATASRTTTTVTNDTARLQKTFSFTGTLAITESGVLNAASGGTLLARQVFSAINVANGDSLQVTWDFAVSS